MSPSIACLPVKIRSYPMARSPAAIMVLVAKVSLPANILSLMRYASSAPIARASLNAFAACAGPIHRTATLSPLRSFCRNASSNAALSSGLMILGTPSRLSVLVTGSIFTSVVSGTCLIQTTIFIFTSFLKARQKSPFSELRWCLRKFPLFWRRASFVLRRNPSCSRNRRGAERIYR